MIPVHNHSEYSALDGYSKPQEIADRIRELRLDGAFLTDHGTVAGFPEFRKAMDPKGTGELFVGYGMEAYQARWDVSRRENEAGQKFKGGEDAFHLVLIAKNEAGYRNLMRLSDTAHREGFYYYPRLDWDLLEKYRDGIIATSACMGSLMNQRLMLDDLEPLNRFVDLYRDDFFIEVHTYDTDLQRALNQELVSIATERGIPYLYANDAHYAWGDQYEAHEALLCAQMNEKLTDPKGRGRGEDFVPNLPDDPLHHHPKCLHIMSEEEVMAALTKDGHLSEEVAARAIEGSEVLRSRVEDIRIKYDDTWPKYRPKGAPRGYDALEDFWDELEKGYEARYPGEDRPDVLERVEAEAIPLIEKEMHEYLLIVKDYIDYAKREGRLVGAGRGSVGGSLTAYLLGLHNVDPLKNDLQFARFWNEDRAGLPDIDTDFEQNFRQGMIKYAEERHGADHVLQVGTHMRMRPRNALDKAAAMLPERPKFEDLKAIKKLIEDTDFVDAGQRQTWEQIFGDDPDKHSVNKEACDKIMEKWWPKYPRLFETAAWLSGRIHTYGIHPSAVVISERDLHSELPARSAAGEGKDRIAVSQAEFHQVEAAGFPKFDFLGLKTLDHLRRTAELSGDFGSPKEAADFFWSLDVDRDVPPEAFEMMDAGHTLGLFQIDTSYGAKRIASKMRPRNLAHLAAIVALNNPGPVRSGTEAEYIKRKLLLDAGATDQSGWYLDPALVPVLSDTHGVLIYQEQVTAYFEMLGFSPARADNVRRMVSKREVEEMRRFWNSDEYLELVAASPFPAEKAGIMQKQIVEFSRYGFNKAHAVAYGTVLGWTLYAKERWPTEFVLAGIEFNPDQVAEYINEARRIGVAVLPPDVNRSQVTISKAGEAEIIYGLRDIKGIGAAGARWVVENRPWADPDAMMEAIKEGDKPPCNLGHFKTLNAAGAFDSTGGRAERCEQCEGTGRWKPDPAVRKREPCPECGATGFVAVAVPGADELAKGQKEYLGVVLVDLYAGLVEKHADRLGKLDPFEWANGEDGIAKVPGVVKEVKKTKTKHGASMGFATITWEGEEARVAVFPDAWEQYQFALKEGALGEFTLKATERGPQLQKVFKLV